MMVVLVHLVVADRWVVFLVMGNSLVVLVLLLVAQALVSLV
jgi:hypothetical protein